MMRNTLNSDSFKIGQNLRNIRKEVGYTQDEVAEILQVTHQQVQKYESGVNRLPLQVMPILCDTFGVQMEQFLDGVGSYDFRRETQDMAYLRQAMAGLRDRKMRQKILDIVDILVA